MNDSRSGTDLRYRLPFDVRFNDINHRHQITLPALFGFLQEAAIRQADERGFGAAELVPKGLTWVLNRVHIRIHRHPAWKEKLVVETWPSTMGGLYATREFRVFDAGQQEIAAGTSRWVIVDIHARRAVRIPEYIAQAFPADQERAIDDAFAKLRVTGDLEESHTFHVRRSDLDANDHANSGRYLDWMLESAPEDLLSDWETASTEIVYQQEALFGHTITAHYREETALATGERVVSHAVINSSKGSTAALGRSTWRRITS